MRGRRDPQATMLAFVDLEERVPRPSTGGAPRTNSEDRQGSVPEPLWVGRTVT